MLVNTKTIEDRGSEELREVLEVRPDGCVLLSEPKEPRALVAEAAAAIGGRLPNEAELQELDEDAARLRSDLGWQ